MAAKKEENVISIPAMDIRYATINIVGDSSLIMHKFSEKAKKEILDKQTKKPKVKGHDIKNPVRDFIDSMYWLEGEPEKKTEEGFYKALENGARFGFPAEAFKDAAIAAAYRGGIIKNQVGMRSNFHVLNKFVEIAGTPVMREDMVRIPMGGADIRYRGEFTDWSATLRVSYNAGVITLEQLVNMINLGGYACGVGEWRVERGGSHGMFHVV